VFFFVGFGCVDLDMKDKTKNIYTLYRISGIGPAIIKKIIDAGYNSIHQLASECDQDELKQYIRGKNQTSVIETITNNTEQHSDKIERELESFNNNGITLYSKWDKEYPIGYKLIKDPPLFIYTKGNPELLNREDSIAIIGTRDCSQKGEEIATRTAKHFAEIGINIVSGLAKGIDTAGHRGALEADGGKTTAVLVDIENIYPAENYDLSDQILENGGLLIAENPPGTPPAGHLFVRRDRLQSGLSLAVFPIETDIKGGTMHTVRFAKEQQRLIFVPDLKTISDYDLRSSRAKGILDLSKTEGVELFTKEYYPQILKKLETKKKDLYKLKDNQNKPIIGQQGDLF